MHICTLVENIKMSIPVVDLSHFTSQNNELKTKFVSDLGKAYEEVGFVAVKNHGISDDLISRMYTEVEGFFSFPEATKRQYEIPGLAGQRGYTSFGKEHAKGFSTADLKEFFQLGQENIPGSLLDVPYPDNVIVAEAPKFTPVLLEAFRSFEKTGLDLMRAIALFLELDEYHFDDQLINGNSILRAIYYPPITSEPASAIRAEQHEDINLITLLIGASADGLQILNMQGEWVSVTSLPEQIVVNVGDMLQRLTNNRLRSTTHRVVNPPREKWSSPRYSIPFFFHPKLNTSLACLESCISESNPKQYADYTAGEYLDERLREIGLK